MKRIFVSLTILAVIIAVGIFALFSVSQKNDRLYGHIEAVISAYESDGDTVLEIQNLQNYFELDYVPKLGAFVDDDLLGEIATCISRLEPMLESDCDEFTAECAAIRTTARKIFLNEAPKLFRIL